MRKAGGGEETICVSSNGISKNYPTGKTNLHTIWYRSFHLKLSRKNRSHEGKTQENISQNLSPLSLIVTTLFIKMDWISVGNKEFGNWVQQTMQKYIRRRKGMEISDSKE